MLAYLALSEQPQSRDVLATLLWPEFDQTRARANLRRTLHILNQSPIQTWLEADSDRIWIESTEGFRVDVLTFERLINSATISDLNDAVDLYKNDFLSGFHLADSNSFDEWAIFKREQYRRQMLGALDSLTTHYLEIANYNQAERLGRRQIEIDSFRESAWRQLMISLAGSGRHTKALTEYEKCRRLLKAELNVQPAAETTELAQSIRDERATQDVLQEDKSKSTDDFPLQTSSKRTLAANLSSISPYRGLYAFREEDAPFFYGRESYVELLTNTITDQSIVPLVGPSGSGKSSILQAGLIAELRQSTNWIIVIFRPGQRPFQALASALVELLSNELSEAEHLIESGKLASAFQDGHVSLYDSVERLLEKHSDAERILLAADQFEELYSFVPDAADRQRFLDFLLETVFLQQYRRDPLFTLVLALRADFLGQALAYRPLADAIQDADVKLGPVTQSEMQRAILKPAESLGVSFESGLVTRIMEDVGQKAGRLPLLQFTLDQLWQKRAERIMTHTSYEEIGGVEGALRGYAEQIYSKLSQPDQALARRIFVQLVQPGETTDDVRRTAPRVELEEEWSLVHYLADARLVVTSHDTTGNDSAELVHEALIYHWDRLRIWLAADREFRLWQERFRPTFRNWLDGGKNDEDLIRGGALATAQDWLVERPAEFLPLEREFIETGTAAAQKRRRRLMVTSAAILAIVLVLLFLALFQWRNAAQARNESVIRLGEQVAVQALSQPDGAYDRSLLLAVEALQIADSPFTRASITQLLLSNLHIRRSTRVSMEQPFFSGGALDPSGRYGVFPAEETVYLWDIESGQRLATTVRPSEEAFTALAGFSPDGQWLAIGQPVTKVINPWTGEQIGGEFRFPQGQVQSLDLTNNARRLAAINESLLAIWDIEYGGIITVSTNTGRNEVPSSSSVNVAFSPDEQQVAAGCDGTNLCVWDSGSGDLVNTMVNNTPGRVTQVAYSPNGKILAAGTSGGNITLWDPTLGKRFIEPPLSHSSPISALAFNSTGDQLASTHTDGAVILWDLTDVPDAGTASRRLMGNAGNSISYITFSDSGSSIVTVLSENNAGTFPPTTDYLMTIWSPEVRSGLPPGIMLEEQDGGVADLTFSQEDILQSADAQLIFREDGSLIVTDPIVDVRTWTISNSRLSMSRKTIPIGLNWTGATLSPGGRWIAIGPPEGSVLLGDLSALDLITRTLEGPVQPVIGIDFSSDDRFLAASSCHEGSLMASTCTKGEAWVWDLNSGRRIGPLTGTDDTIGGLDLSDDGRWLVTSGSELLLWNLASDNPQPILVDEAPGSGPDAFTFVELSPDGQWMAASQTEGIQLWKFSETGEWIQWQLEEGLEQPQQVAFDPGNNFLVAGNFSGELTLWDLKTGDLLAQPEKQQFHQVYALAFNEAGTMLASGSLDGRIVVWDFSQMLEGIESSADLLINRACEIANRNLSSSEWETYFSDQPYRQTCFYQ